jgi:hypothetical protein
MLGRLALAKTETVRLLQAIRCCKGSPLRAGTVDETHCCRACVLNSCGCALHFRAGDRRTTLQSLSSVLVRANVSIACRIETWLQTVDLRLVLVSENETCGTRVIVRFDQDTDPIGQELIHFHLNRLCRLGEYRLRMFYSLR